MAGKIPPPTLFSDLSLCHDWHSSISYFTSDSIVVASAGCKWNSIRKLKIPEFQLKELESEGSAGMMP